MADESRIEDEVVREFIRCERMLREFIRGLVSHRQDAEDVYQETAVVVLRRGGGVVDMEAFQPWCRSVARNIARNYWRKKGRQKLELWEDLSRVLDECYSERDTGLDADNDRRRWMDVCVVELPGRSRQLLRMFYVEGIRSRDMARRLRRSHEAVRVALLRIREVVRNCVKLRMAEGEASHAN